MRVFPDILPTQFGVILLALTLALSLTPWLSGRDFGILKIPNFPSNVQNKMKIIGPALLLIVVVLHIPLRRKTVIEVAQELKPYYEVEVDIDN